MSCCLLSIEKITKKSFINQYKKCYKKYLLLEISILETSAFIEMVYWIIAYCFVPLPEVNSLGL
jgi:hypothetical protein